MKGVWMFGQSFTIFRACQFESTSLAGGTWETKSRKRSQDVEGGSIRGWWHEKPSVQPSDGQKGRQTHILTVNTTSFFCTAFRSWLRLSCVSPCCICCQLSCIKVKIYYWNNTDDDDDDDRGDEPSEEYHSKYCISIVYVADLYWLFTTVEQKSYPEA